MGVPHGQVIAPSDRRAGRAPPARQAEACPTRHQAEPYATYSNLMPERSATGLGYLRLMASNSSRKTCETARLRNHLRFAGITYQGAHSVLHWRSISWYASIYWSQYSRSLR